jgi:hypothetical protein
MITSYNTIAESFFDAGPDIPTRFGFSLQNGQLLFEGAMAYFEIQTKTNLDTPWTTLRGTSSNLSLPMSDSGAGFFRALLPP